MKYYIIAGEASGDLHGANLIKGLLHEDPQAEIRFWGGDLMSKAAGAQGTLIKHYKESSVMGFWEVFKSLGRIRKLMKLCREDIAAQKPEVVILIDYPGFNLRIAKFAKSIGIPTYYYIAPKVWAWKEGRVKRIKKYVDRLFVIFPFEIEYFRKHGIEAFYAGNPIMDSAATLPPTPESDRAFRAEHNLGKKPIVALVAGSRKAEVQYNLPVMAEISRAFPDYQFVVTGVSWLDKELYDKALAGSDVRYTCDAMQAVIRHAVAALVTSGTATLETAVIGTPQVVCFKNSPITMWIAKRVVKLPYISLVNLVVWREVVKELIQENFTVATGTEALRAILPGGPGREKMLDDYADLRGHLGEPGSSERIASEMVKSLILHSVV